jgi:hypothetical protein
LHGFGDFFLGDLRTRDFFGDLTFRHLPFDPLTLPSLHGFGDFLLGDLRARDFLPSLCDDIYYTI